MFPIRTILLVVDFPENCTLQAQNEIQSQYYHSKQVNIMVDNTFMHGPDSSKCNRVIFKYHLYISDDVLHDLAYVQQYI